MTTLELEVQDLKERVQWLEEAVQQLLEEKGPTTLMPDVEELSEWERLLAELKAEGLIRDLTLEEQVHADRWRSLPEEEKQAIIQEMLHVKPGPMLSDIVLQNRR